MENDQLAIFMTPNTDEFASFIRKWYVVHTGSPVDDAGDVAVHFMGPHSDTKRQSQSRRRGKQAYDASAVHFSLAWTRKNGTEVYQQTQPTYLLATSAWVPASSILWCGLELGRGRWGTLPPAILKQLPNETYNI